MADKQLTFSAEARTSLMRGVDELSRVVGLTLGPSGRNVLFSRMFGLPVVCSDGVTIAKEIELPDAYENMGAQLVKEAASKTNDVVGDGTTTSVVLTQAIVRQGFLNVAAGASGMALKSGIEKAVETVVTELKQMAIPVENRDQIARVAALSAHEEAIAQLLADAMDKVGREGVITIEESKAMDDELEVVEGVRIDRGYLSPHFVTDTDRMEAALDDPLFLITDQKLSSPTDIVATMEMVIAEGRRPLVVIAEDVDGEALATLVVNKMRGTLGCVAIKAPGFGERRKALLEDMAILTGSTVISSDVGLRLDSVEMSHLGSARRLVALKDDSTIIDGRGSADAVKDRAAQLKVQIEETSSDYDREKLEERLASLVGGVAVIKIGGTTEPEVNERKSRAEDALSATKAAVEEGIVPGGGVALLRCLPAISRLKLEGDEQIGVDIVKRAVEAPLRALVENAGVEGAIVVKEVLDRKGNIGYDVTTQRYTDLMKAGVVDPAKVSRSALQNAASIAGLLLTTECLITDVPEDEKPMPDGGHDHM